MDMYMIWISVPFLICSSGTTNRDWVYYTLISIPSVFTLIGLMYMIQKVCSPKMRECCLDLEKEDINNEYGTYYDTNSEMWQNRMEVTFDTLQSQSTVWLRRYKIGIQHMKPVTLARLMTMTTWETKTYILPVFLSSFNSVFQFVINSNSNSM